MFIRHGERCDYVEDKSERARITVESDTPLTKLGVAQAHVCGQNLKKFFATNHFDKIVIESSPFLRTLETAAGIAHELGVNEITTNYLVGEWLSDHLFPDGQPIDAIHINSDEASVLKMFAAKGITIHHDST